MYFLEVLPLSGNDVVETGEARWRMRPSRRMWLRSFLAIVVLIAVGGGSWAAIRSGLFDRPSPLELLPRATAHRADLFVTIVAGGEVQTANPTLIECELENLRVHAEGGTARASGSSVIIELVEDGAMVRKGDVLCRLDSSEYEELRRQQEIKNQAAQADRDKAVLDLESAEIALTEYRDGKLAQLRENFREQRALYESDIERQGTRIVWAKGMVEKGYLDEGRLRDSEETLLRSQVSLEGILRDQRILEDYTAPIQLKKLEIALMKARSELHYQEIRLEHRQEQLDRLVEQIENCTIRAPHDGMVIYANEDDDDAQIALGTEVRKHMDLFYLPDLSKMEVHVNLHESVVARIEQGMAVNVRVNGLVNRVLRGTVMSVDPLPMSKRSWRQSDEVKNFLAKIRIDYFSPDLLPEMTAVVEILVGREVDVLVVPTSTISVEGGKEYCYVPRGEALERRQVRTAPGNAQLIRIKAGLSEGDEVVSKPTSEAMAAVEIIDVPTDLPPVPEPSFRSEYDSKDFLAEDAKPLASDSEPDETPVEIPEVVAEESTITK